MRKPNYNPDALNELLDEFDFASSHLALVPNLENALNANIASLRWADLLYDMKGKVPKDLAQRYLLDVNGCIDVLDRLRKREDYAEKKSLKDKGDKVKRERRASHHIAWYIDQMRARIGLVRELSKEGY